MLGLEPQRRNRTTTKEKPNRVTKSKKEPRDLKSKKEDITKSESNKDDEGVADSTEFVPPTPRIKQESVPPSYNSRLTPASMSTTPAAHSHNAMQHRLLTPCSDTDGYPTSPAITTSPAAEMINSQASYDFPMGHYAHDQAMWSHSPMFPAYETPYAFDGGMQMTFDPRQGMHHHGECISMPPSGDGDGEHAGVKHEHWDNHCI